MHDGARECFARWRERVGRRGAEHVAAMHRPAIAGCWNYLSRAIAEDAIHPDRDTIIDLDRRVGSLNEELRAYALTFQSDLLNAANLDAAEFDERPFSKPLRRRQVDIRRAWSAAARRGKRNDNQE